MAITETQIDKRARMTILAKGFQVLTHAPGIDPWDAEKLDEWAASGANNAERHAAAFVLHVWNSYGQWQVGRFDVMAALSVWDEVNRKPFIEWAMNPHWE